MNSRFDPAPPVKARLRVEDFLLLDASGAFASYAKAELIDGEIFVVNAQHRPHAWIKSRLANILHDSLKDHPTLAVLTEVGLDTGSASLPEPDIVVTDEPRGEGFVPIASVHLLGEVSDSSLAYDMGTKAKLYASLSVPEYWVVDVNARVIHQHWSPDSDEYREKRTTSFGDPLVAATLPGITVSTEGI